MDAIPLFRRNTCNIQVAGFEFCQCRRGIQEAVLDLIDLGLRHGFVSGPERIFDECQVRIVDPFLEGVRTVALIELLLCPAVCGGLITLIAFNHPLRCGMSNPQAQQVQVVDSRRGECVFNCVLVDGPDTYRSGIGVRAIVEFSSAFQIGQQCIGVIGGSGRVNSAGNAIYKVLRGHSAVIALTVLHNFYLPGLLIVVHPGHAFHNVHSVG